MRAAVVTVSSSLARGEGEDVSGTRLAELCEAAGLDVSLETVSDDREAIVGLLKRLVDVVGPSFAKEIFYTARQFTAAEALTMGLVNRVLPEAELEKYVADYAATISGNAPLTVNAVKYIVGEAVKDESQRNMQKCADLVAQCFASKDYIEGRTAFMEKRKPQFTGT